VVKAWADLDEGQLVFYDPECTLASINHPQIDWNAIHKQWSGHHFDWWTNLLDLTGGTIKTIQGTQGNPGTGDTTWDGSRTPPAGNAGLGIYSFQVAHQHKTGTHPNCAQLGECGPQSDKPGSLAIEDLQTDDEEFSFGEAGEFVRLELTYRLTRLASVCRVTLYAVNAGGRAENHATNPFHNLGAQNLPRSAGTHVQTLTWNVDPRLYCRFWVVIEAKENASVARLYNRDRKPKWAVPKGFPLVFRPIA
jgi:hypothetical protein